jgi:hypothetical protein
MNAARATKELQKNLSDAIDARLNGNTLGLVDRAGMINALVSVAHFMQRIDGLKLYSNQFSELASVFMDLNQGKRHPIVTPKNMRRRPFDRTDIWCARGRVAFAIHLLMRSGMKKRDAFQFVTTKYWGLENLILKSDTAKTLSVSIKNWYEKFCAKRVNVIEASEMYEDLVSASADRFNASKKLKAEMKEFAVRHLAQTATFKPLRGDNVSLK